MSAAAGDRIPLFPLPNVVHFPHTLLPLHIFEPRYRAMTEAALEGDRRLGMALLKPGWDQDYQGNPPVYDVVGVGRVVHDERLPDGRFNLWLQGQGRGRILEIVSDHPYRTARVEMLEDRAASDDAVPEMRRRLEAMLGKLGKDVVQGLGGLVESIAVGTLCDILASCLVQEIADQQRLLEELDVAARYESLIKLLERQPPPRRPSWPTEPSPN